LLFQSDAWADTRVNVVAELVFAGSRQRSEPLGIVQQGYPIGILLDGRTGGLLLLLSAGVALGS
jgi:hypothetical protein